MVRKSKLTAVIIILFLASIACADLQPGRTSPSEDSVPSGGVLFEDDFSDTSGPWGQLSDATGTAKYENGAFRITVHAAQYDIWSTPGLNYTNVIIEVDATKNAGPNNNDFGVICRHQDENNFYVFLIASDGYFAIMQVKDAEYFYIQSTDMEYSSVIHQGRGTNQIRAECVGDRLSLFTNGQLLAQANNTDFTSGDVGLIAGTFNTPGTDILFDNFVVLKP